MDTKRGSLNTMLTCTCVTMDAKRGALNTMLTCTCTCVTMDAKRGSLNTMLTCTCVTMDAKRGALNTMLTCTCDYGCKKGIFEYYAYMYMYMCDYGCKKGIFEYYFSILIFNAYYYGRNIIKLGRWSNSCSSWIPSSLDNRLNVIIIKGYFSYLPHNGNELSTFQIPTSALSILETERQ